MSCKGQFLHDPENVAVQGNNAEKQQTSQGGNPSFKLATPLSQLRTAASLENTTPAPFLYPFTSLIPSTPRAYHSITHPYTMAFTTNATIASFGGKLLKLTHEAKSTSCKMNLNLYLPPQAFSAQKMTQKVPVLFYLSGLTCTGDNCSEKGFFQHKASEKGIAVVYPDTSPRKTPQSLGTCFPRRDNTTMADRCFRDL